MAVPVFIVVQPTSASTSQIHLAAASGTTTASTAADRVLRYVPAVAATTTTAAPTTTTEAPPTTIPETVPPTRLPAPHGPRATPGGNVALTFDDGPNPTYTPQVLDVLARYGIHATFFLVGSEVEQAPQLVRRMLAEGHSIGNHTWDHADLTTLDDEGFRQQVDRTEDLLNEIAGGRVPCVRPPFGRSNQYALDQIHARGLTQIKWSRDSADWKRPGVSTIISNALSGVGAGSVILFHDSGPDMSQTVEALPAIIENIQSRGLAFSSVCQLQ